VGWSRFFRRAYWDAERARELDAHLQIETDENVARGMTPEEARYAALRKLGNVTLWREEIYRMNTAPIVDTLWQDLRYAFRQWRHHPGFTALAVFTLALGIGSVAVMYSVLHNIVLEPFPYADQQRMVDVVVRDLERPDGLFRGPLPADEFLDYQEQSSSFEDVIGTSPGSRIYSTGDSAERLTVATVTPNAFQFLGVAPLLGRALVPDDGRPGAPPAAAISHAAWTRYFGSDPGVLGRTMVLDGEPWTVVAIMPPRFTWHVADVWIPSRFERGGPRAGTVRWFQARLKPGVTTAAAEAELQVIAARRAREHPDEYPARFRIQVITVIDWVVGRFRGVLYTLLAAVFLLLLIACCNVANMLLARATGREREMTLRATLGASRLRLVRQLLIESVLLALAGAAAGCLLAWAGLKALVRAMPRQNVPWETEIALDGPVLAFALAAAALSAVAFGLLPALHGARKDVMPGLRQSGKGTAAGARHGRVRGALVVAQVALSLVLLLGAGLLMRTFLALVRVDLGFDPSRIIYVPVSFAPGTYPKNEERQRFFRQAVQRVADLPGVEAAAQANGTPPFDGLSSRVEIAGVPAPPGDVVEVRFGSEEYIRLVGLSLRRGRGLSEADVVQARRVAVVSETLATRFFPGRDPVGQTITLPRLRTLPEPVVDPAFEIVGVYGDVSNAGPRNRPAPEMLVPSSVAADGRLIVARTAPGALVGLDALRREIWAVDRSVGLMDGRRLEDDVERAFHAQPRFTMIILAAFAGIGLLLVSLGVYGVLAYAVSRQTQEIAVRMALGAGRGEVLSLVLHMGLELVAAGVIVGLLASIGTNRLISSQLWNTSAYDPTILLAAVVVIACAGLAACYVPAARALRVDPITALRLE
jgi:putative ABC transport system permease protein